MSPVTATDCFLALCARTGERWDAAVDALTVGEALGILAPMTLSHVDELKRRGWIEEAAILSWEQLTVRVTAAGAGHDASEKRRRNGVT